MVPNVPPLCGNIIKSPLFRESETCHPCTYGVCSESTFSPVTVFHFSSSCISSIILIFGLKSFYSVFDEPLFESLTIPSGFESIAARSTIFIIFLWQGKSTVRHPSCFLPSSSLVSVHQSLCYVPLCVCWGFLIALTLAGSLLSTSTHLFQKSSLEGNVPWF